MEFILKLQIFRYVQCW